jgi:acid-sensing ion channel, other
LRFEQKPLIQINAAHEARAIISIEQTKTDKSVHDLSVHQRKCIFSNEISLNFFKDEPYTYTGCLKQCKLDQAIDMCGCIPPFYRSKQLANSTFCDLKSLKCLKDEKVFNIAKCDHCELACDFTTISPVRYSLM